ncbi:MAG: DUF4209 domain-containing protein [Bryobacterales bacterium]|nr:DUF4209 domain-containing protein [Bryobacterales bacterium]
MAITVPEPTLRALAEVEGSNEKLADYELGSRLAGIHNLEGLSPEERKGAWAESAAFNFMARIGDTPNPWDTHFGPVFSGTKNDGAPFYVPDLAEVDRDIISHWEERSTAAKHPMLRARYSDLVWDFKRTAIGENPAVAFAQRACDAYLEVVDAGIYKEPIHGVLYLQRALSVALSINDKERLSRAKQAMLALAEQIRDPRQVGTWAFVFDDLIENKRVQLDEVEVQEIIANLESCLSSCSAMGHEQFDPWAAQAAADRLAGFYERNGRKEDVHRVVRAYGTAFEQIAAKANPTLAMGWLQPVFDDYRSRGMKDDATRVQLASAEKGKDAASDLQQFKVPVEISRQEIVDFLAAMVEGSPTDTLLRIAGQFIPKASEARAFLSEIAKEHPLLGLISVTKIADGHFAAKAGSIEKDPDGRLIMQLAENLALAAPFLNGALRKAIDKHGLDSERILDVLYVSPAFDPDRKDLLKSGIDAYLAGDYIKTVHVLVPQIEHSLRRVLALLGEPVGKAGRNGTMQVKNLNDILREEAILNCLGEDLQMYLLTFLADARGQNLRNRITHGLAPMAQIDVQAADRLIHVLLAISLIRERAKQDL